MHELFSTLGIDWKLLLAQGFNFAIVLIVLTRFVYRPLVVLMDERRRIIEKGVEDAAAAEVRLLEITKERKIVLRAAEKEGELIIEELETRGRENAAIIVERAESDARQLIRVAEVEVKNRKENELEKLKDGIGELIASAISKAVSLDYKKIDKALIAEASDILKKELRSL